MKILIAEDDITSRTILYGLLKKRGYDPIAVSDGKEAWDVLKGSDPPSLDVLDWNMPRMDGLELCMAIREDGSRGYVFILLLTSRNSREDIVTGLEAGADDYLIKPPDPLELDARPCFSFTTAGE